MAVFIPSIEDVRKLKVHPEEGELYLLEFLSKALDDSFEVYFNPYLNGDRPDIIIMKKELGVMIIEVKDWNLKSYELDDKGNWRIKNATTEYVIKSPILQVYKYKKNLFDLHIEQLLEQKVIDIRNFNTVFCGVYFHNATEDELKPYEEERKENNQRFKQKIHLLGRDSLTKEKIINLFSTIFKFKSFFTEDMYKSIKRFISPPIHLKEEGKEVSYVAEQRGIVYDTERKQLKLMGVFGSGKTTILAGRAVQLYKKTGGKILILTYNITLRNFIRDKISKVREDFAWENFVILNYHSFIKLELNNLGISIKAPENISPSDKKAIEDYFENNYYSNVALFKSLNIQHKYDAILVDEVQDYKRPWLDILKGCFLAPNGYYMLLGDIKQNIYNNPTENRNIITNIAGDWNKLKSCYRSLSKIRDLALEFQDEFYKDKYEKDQKESQLVFKSDGYLNYINLSGEGDDSVKALYTIIHENAINKGIPPNDITILGETINFLRDFDAFYRYASNENTKTMFETWELIYKKELNELSGFIFKPSESPTWLRKASELVNQPSNLKKGIALLSELFTLYDLYEKTSYNFADKIDVFCNKEKISKNSFLQLINTNEVSNFRNKTKYKATKNDLTLESIRDNKKYNFWFNSGTIKLSTIHSFKGWESELLFLIIEPKQKIVFDELIYTGITRSRSQLIIVNYGNTDYHERLKKIVDKVK
ncbi:NERD domain-containing protein [Capnocytophaga leadbetteri]|uniref:nuclease-related domain-containing DEAD/DEAH box helicase n=1 Tax=Capnocytophaga leadbetteri TaxID=327575 RepID=UPI0028E3D10D|nr:NERD domain-containing protein [Capnocytophaga leadbetteri]